MMETESSLLKPLTNSETVSLPEYEFTLREKIKECFKPRYSVRKVSNKGALLVLIWTFLMFSLYFYISYTVSQLFKSKFYVIIIQSTIGVTIPFAGWLADVRFGRYKVISLSIWIMWLSSLFLTTGLVIGQLVNINNDSYYYKILLVALAVPLGLAFGSFQANIIQFGVDQLHDSSSREIMAFVIWYVWAGFSSISTVCMMLLYTSETYKLFASLYVCINLTLAVSLNVLFKNVLIVEPRTQNPFRLVYNIVKYAINNKQPRRRTAFAYCENYLPSRIDFGKSKYGGPFTTEQVEDVKTLFRVLVVIFIGSAFYGMTVKQRNNGANLRTIFLDAVSRSPKYVFASFYYIVGTVLIPLHEFLVYPLFQRCLPNLNASVKFLVGAILCFVWYTIHMALITYARVQYHITNVDNYSRNATLQCLFHDNAYFLSDTLDYKWAVLLEIIWAMSQQFMLFGGIEFWCAQVPYTMKGFVAGIIYGFPLLFMAFSQATSLPFKTKSISWSTGALSCGFWYLLTMLVLMVILIAGLAVVAKWYKGRKREDVLLNEHIFAENYYSKYLS